MGSRLRSCDAGGPPDHRGALHRRGRHEGDELDFVEVFCGTETVGTGEATLSGAEPAVVRTVSALSEGLTGASPSDASVLLHGHPRSDMVTSAAVGGIEQAVEDLLAQLAGRSLAAVLVGAPPQARSSLSMPR